jgi:hypothetical protein
LVLGALILFLFDPLGILSDVVPEFVPCQVALVQLVLHYVLLLFNVLEELEFLVQCADGVLQVILVELFLEHLDAGGVDHLLGGLGEVLGRDVSVLGCSVLSKGLLEWTHVLILGVIGL